MESNFKTQIPAVEGRVCCRVKTIGGSENRGTKLAEGGEGGMSTTFFPLFLTRGI